MMPRVVISSPQKTTIGSDPRVWRGAHIYTRCNDTRNDSCHSIQSRAAVKPHGMIQTQLMSRETLQGSVETLVSLYLLPCCRPIVWAYSQGGEEAGGGGGGGAVWYKYTGLLPLRYGLSSRLPVSTTASDQHMLSISRHGPSQSVCWLPSWGLASKLRPANTETTHSWFYYC